MIKASKLIKELMKGKTKAKIVSEGDSLPYLRFVNVDVKDDHTCTVRGTYGYAEDSARYGTDEGQSEAKVFGIIFTAPYTINCEDIEIEGDVEYDKNLTEDDLIEVALNYIEWPIYDSDEIEFDESSVTDSELLNLMECKYHYFALNEKNEVCAFESKNDIPSKGYTEIDESKAFEILSKKRPGLHFEEIYN